jgi:hypothetical protein
MNLNKNKKEKVDGKCHARTSEWTLPSPSRQHAWRRKATKISQPSCLLKRLVEAYLLGWRVLFSSRRFGGGWVLFSPLSFLYSLIEINVRSTKKRDCPSIYFVFQSWSFFLLVFISFGFFFLNQFHPFLFDFV